ncbi:hypothetical protein MLD38_004824 [Melastoma candidum]|uniref:Uncharacterized protein n=1 Tax=Melastoma candidum TaxID=119954 RepID=A0ACB9S8V0_9MYRT|nr:hypothetical protein MLD38_004824 [Melastoma candidum]
MVRCVDESSRSVVVRLARLFLEWCDWLVCFWNGAIGSWFGIPMVVGGLLRLMVNGLIGLATFLRNDCEIEMRLRHESNQWPDSVLNASMISVEEFHRRW